MHEMSIAQSLIEIIEEEMLKYDAKILRSVRLNIGQMSAIVPDALSFCFEVITSGTELEGARLIMDIIPLKGYCYRCKSEFEIKDYTFICPSCGTHFALSGIDVDRRRAPHCDHNRRRRGERVAKDGARVDSSGSPRGPPSRSCRRRPVSAEPVPTGEMQAETATADHQTKAK